MTTDLHTWLNERETIHDNAADISEGKWFACRYQIGAGDDPGDPAEIVGDLNAKAYATAIVDAHNTLPKLVRGVRAVLELHRRATDIFDPVEFCAACSTDQRTVEYPCPTVQKLREVIDGE